MTLQNTFLNDTKVSLRLQEKQDIMAALLIVIMVIILFGNGTVVVAIIRYQRLRIPTNHFVLTLALTDIMLALSLPYHVVFYMAPSLVTKKYACLWRYISFLLPCGTSQTHVLAITVDRYLSVMYPLQYTTLMTSRRVFIISGLLWLYSTILGIVPFYWNHWEDHCTCALTSILNVGYIIILAVHFFVISVVVMVLYSRVFAITRKLQQGIMKPVTGFTRYLPEKGQRKTRPLLLYGLVVCLFCFLWTPFFVIVLIQMLWFNNKILITIGQISILVGLTTSVINPMIYVVLNKAFRKAYCDMFHLKQAGKSFNNLFTAQGAFFRRIGKKQVHPT